MGQAPFLQVEEGETFVLLVPRQNGELRQTPIEVGEAPSHPTPTPNGLMAADGTPAPGGCQGLLALGTQTWITVCLGGFLMAQGTHLKAPTGVLFPCRIE